MKISPCISLLEGQNHACKRVGLNKQFQIALLIPFNSTLETNFYNKNYRGSFSSEIDKIVFQAPKQSNAISGNYKKTEDEFGFGLYEHRVTLLISAFSEEEKKQIHALNNGLWQVILFSKDKTAELYGGYYGLKTRDYEYKNTPEIIELSSIKKERAMPLLFNGEELHSIMDNQRIFDFTF